MAAASNTPTAAGADGRSSERPVAMTTSRPAAGERPRSKPSMTNQKESPKTNHESSVQAKPTKPSLMLRNAITPTVRLRTAASTRFGDRNGRRARGRKTKRTALSP